MKIRSRRRKLSSDDDESWSVEERTLFRSQSEFISFMKGMVDRSCNLDDDKIEGDGINTKISDDLNESSG